jgi:hypothetical protein
VTSSSSSSEISCSVSPSHSRAYLTSPELASASITSHSSPSKRKDRFPTSASQSTSP